MGSRENREAAVSGVVTCVAYNIAAFQHHGEFACMNPIFSGDVAL